MTDADNRKSKNERQKRSWRRRKEGVRSIRLTTPIEIGHGVSIGLAYYRDLELEDYLRGIGLLKDFAEPDRETLEALFIDALRKRLRLS